MSQGSKIIWRMLVKTLVWPSNFRSVSPIPDDQSLLVIHMPCVQEWTVMSLLCPGDRWEVLSCPAGGAPRLPHLPLLALLHQTTPGSPQPLSRQRGAKPRGGGGLGGPSVAYPTRRKRLGKVKGLRWKWNMLASSSWKDHIKVLRWRIIETCIAECNVRLRCASEWKTLVCLGLMHSKLHNIFFYVNIYVVAERLKNRFH